MIGARGGGFAFDVGWLTWHSLGRLKPEMNKSRLELLADACAVYLEVTGPLAGLKCYRTDLKQWLSSLT